LAISSEKQIFEDAQAVERSTNNAMEIQGALEGIRAIFNQDPQAHIEVRTDSQYLIRGITTHLRGWKARGWMTLQGKPVAHQSLWEELERLGGPALDWVYVPGHAGFVGNERVDTLAVLCSKGSKPALYSGPAEGYRLPLRELLLPIPDIRKYPNPIYLSYVDGRLFRDPSWSECEKRVKGRSGVKFKKVESAEEENLTLKNWGVEPS
jgi:ribonuclease HI